MERTRQATGAERVTALAESEKSHLAQERARMEGQVLLFFFFFITLGIELSGTNADEP